MNDVEYKKCFDCDGSGHIFIPQIDSVLPKIEHCLTCRGTGRVPADSTSTSTTVPEMTDADRRRQETYKGENT